MRKEERGIEVHRRKKVKIRRDERLILEDGKINHRSSRSLVPRTVYIGDARPSSKAYRRP
jgi:hypothetical protein